MVIFIILWVGWLSWVEMMVSLVGVGVGNGGVVIFLV